MLITNKLLLFPKVHEHREARDGGRHLLRDPQPHQATSCLKVGPQACMLPDLQREEQHNLDGGQHEA